MSAIDHIPLSAICHARMEEWAKQMAERTSTPILAIGIGHEQAMGEVHLYVPENLPAEEIELFLFFAIRELQTRRKVA